MSIPVPNELCEQYALRFSKMKESILKKAVRIATEEYEVFSHLSLGLRIGAVLALTLLYFALVILTHLTIYPYLIAGPKSSTVLSIIYSFVLTLATLTILPILFPRLREKSSLAMFVVCALNFFPFVILAFLIPRLRKYKTAIMSITVFLSIGVAGLVVMLEGTSEGVLSEQPGPATIGLWLIGLISIFAGIFIYGYVTEKTSVEKTRIETEVKIAQDIQSQLVPTVDLCGEGYELFGKTKSAYQIGGDFFEVTRLSAQKFVVAIGDVSGHNIAAGLLMAITKGAFRTALQHTSSLEELVKSMNRTILENSDKKMFVSFKCCEFDLTTNSVTTVNAGHLPMFQYKNRAGTVVERNHPGLALGLAKEANYESQQIFFDKGDLFILLTDGIVEAANVSAEQFGFNRFKHAIERLAAEPGPKHIYEELMSELNDFTSSRSLSDDVTFVAIKIAQQ